MRRVAVLLNRNAQGVTPGVIARVRDLHDPGDVFVTSSVREADAAMETVALRAYDVLCIGGGDGTFVHAVQALHTYPGHEVILFALGLGSGNAMAEVCGASRPTTRGLARDLARAAGDAPPAVVPLIEADGRLTCFAGVGLDAWFNEDLDAIAKKWRRRPWIGPLARGARGVFATAALRTLPRLLTEPRGRVRVLAAGAGGFRLDRDGEPAGDLLRAGALLFEGEVTIASASAVRTFGRGLTFFPFAGKHPGRFHLRVSTAGALQALWALPRVFRGTYHNPAILQDFAMAGVRIELLAPCPMQIGGDLCYPDGAITILHSQRTIRLLRAQ